MADINFIVLKINGIDISETPHCDAVKLFLKASEPITLEVRRPKSNDLQKFHITNAYIPPPTPVITSSSSFPSLRSSSSSSKQRPFMLNSPRSAVDFISVPPLTDENTKIGEGELESPSPVSRSPSTGYLGRKSLVSTGIQTDAVVTEYIFSDASLDDQSNENIFDEGLPPEIDIEEVTLQKTASNEKLGLTVSYSSGSDDTDTCTEVYISDIIPNSVAARDGRLRQGDQILQVNGRDVSCKEDTENLIAENKNAVTFLVSRYLYMDDEVNASFEEYDRDFDQQAYQNCLLTSPGKQHSNLSPITPDHRYSSEQTNSNTSKSSSSHKSATLVVDKVKSNATKDIKTEILLDSINSLNIEAHLESVNKELAQLTSRMENSMMHGISGLTAKPLKEEKANSYDSAQTMQNPHASYIYRTPIDNVSKTTASVGAATSTVPAGSGTTTKTSQSIPASQTSTAICIRRMIESDTEHIYETIPEDIESEPFYCLPYESMDRNLVEQWLEMQNCQQELHSRQQVNRLETPTKVNNGRGNRKDRNGLLLNQIKATVSNNKPCSKTIKSNSSGEDHENSSSAYNTGGSCNSNTIIAPEKNSNEEGGISDKTGNQRANIILNTPSTSQAMMFQSQPCTTHCVDTFTQNTNENCDECQRQKKEKVNSPKHEQQPKSPQKLLLSSQGLASTRFQNISGSIPVGYCMTQPHPPDPPPDKSPEISTDTMYTNMANLKKTMLLQQKLFRQTLIRQNIALAQASQISTAKKTPSPSNDRLHFTAPNLSQYHFVSSQEVRTIQPKPVTYEEPTMVWKVKRRQDGSRYIVRRPVRNRILRERALRLSNERYDQTTEDDTISEIKTGRYWTREERKKHIERAKERRIKQQLTSLNRCDTTENTLPVGGVQQLVLTVPKKPQGCLPCGQLSAVGAGMAVNTGNGSMPSMPLSQNRIVGGISVPSAISQNAECPTLHKKSMKKKRKDEVPSNSVVETNNKMVPFEMRDM